jgi:hypothetical protein
MTESNLQIKSNLMVEKTDGFEVTNSKYQRRYFPGDFAALIEPSRMKDNRGRERYFTRQQIDEYQQTIVCLTCKRPCAGTCKRS